MVALVNVFSQLVAGILAKILYSETGERYPKIVRGRNITRSRHPHPIPERN